MKNFKELLIESLGGSSFKEEVRYKKSDFEQWRKVAGERFDVEDLGDNLLGVYLNNVHIATYNIKTQTLMCDDTKLFGH
jgi:hypothetical protein